MQTLLKFFFFFSQWRWKIFSHGTKDMNSAWWELRAYHQGVIPPVARTDKDLDPASKYHIISDQPYVRYVFRFCILCTSKSIQIQYIQILSYSSKF